MLERECHMSTVSKAEEGRKSTKYRFIQPCLREKGKRSLNFTAQDKTDPGCCYLRRIVHDVPHFLWDLVHGGKCYVLSAETVKLQFSYVHLASNISQIPL